MPCEKEYSDALIALKFVKMCKNDGDTERKEKALMDLNKRDNEYYKCMLKYIYSE